MHKLVSNAIATAFLLAALTPVAPANAQGLFQLPNFIGDVRGHDSHYDTMHQYGFDPWDSYQLLLQSYVAEARGQGNVPLPNPPYSRYNYAANVVNPGPGGAVPSPAGDVPTFVDGSSGIYVDPSNGKITGTGGAGVASAAMTTSTNVSGTVLTPAVVNSMPAPGLVGN